MCLPVFISLAKGASASCEAGASDAAVEPHAACARAPDIRRLIFDAHHPTHTLSCLLFAYRAGGAVETSVLFVRGQGGESPCPPVCARVRCLVRGARCTLVCTISMLLCYYLSMAQEIVGAQHDLVFDAGTDPFYTLPRL